MVAGTNQSTESLRTSQRKPWQRPGFWLVLGSFLTAIVIVLVKASEAEYWTEDPSGSISGSRVGVGLVVYFIFLLIGTSLVRNTWRSWPTKWPGRFGRVGISATLAVASFSGLLLADPAFCAEYSPGTDLVWILILTLIFLVAISTVISAWNGLVWLIRRRMHRWLMAGLAGILCLAVGFRWEENWRGRHAWENYRNEWEAKGEHFDLASFIPPPVADDENFAIAPIIAKSLAGMWVASTNQESVTDRPQTGLLTVTELRSIDPGVTNVIIGRWETGTSTDLSAWQRYYRAAVATNEYPSYFGRMPMALGAAGTNDFPTGTQPQTPAEDVLLALSKNNGPLAELAAAARRPLARFPIQYQTPNPQQILLPHLAPLKRCALVLQLRAIAELAAGRSPAALADVKLILRMSEAIRSEPFLFSASVRTSLLDLAIQPIWEGIHHRQWTEPELTELGQALASTDLTSEWNGAIRGERAADIATVEYWRRHWDDSAYCMYRVLLYNIPDCLRNSMDCLPHLPAPLARLWDDGFEDSGSETRLGSWFAHLPPDGWYNLNKVELGLDYQSMALTAADLTKHRLSLREMRRAASDYGSRAWYWNRWPGSCLGAVLFPDESEVVLRFGSTQNAVDMARVACAMEIYRRHHDTYPATLGDLTPGTIPAFPLDVINNEPLHYRRLNDEHYRIYSVGWNGRDDGGTVGRNAAGFYDPKVGDWVWEN